MSRTALAIGQGRCIGDAAAHPPMMEGHRLAVTYRDSPSSSEALIAGCDIYDSHAMRAALTLPNGTRATINIIIGRRRA
jgi:3-oxoacyl-[acyl-carrier protein] reductase